MKKHLFALYLCLVAFAAQSQSEVSTSKQWAVVFENSKVKISSKYVDCEVPSEGLYAEYVLLKAENLSNETIQLSWYNDTYFPELGCTNCDHNRRDTKRQITLKPKETLIGDCQPGYNNGLKVFVKWLRNNNTHILSKLILTDIQTTSLH